MRRFVTIVVIFFVLTGPSAWAWHAHPFAGADDAVLVPTAGDGAPQAGHGPPAADHCGHIFSHLLGQPVQPAPAAAAGARAWRPKAQAAVTEFFFERPLQPPKPRAA